MEALHARLLAAASDHQLHHVIANLLAPPPTVSILARLSVLATFIRIVTPEDFVGLNADHETPYEALKQVTKWVHGPDFIQEALSNQTLGMTMRATPLVWTALQMPPQPAATALAIRALRQGGVNPLLQWAENPRPLIAAWNEVADPALRAALADAILRSVPRMQAVSAEVVDAVTHQLPQPLAHETAKALADHHVHVVVGEPQLSLETFLGERNGAFAMAFHARLGAASEARHAEAVEAVLRQYI